MHCAKEIYKQCTTIPVAWNLRNTTHYRSNPRFLWLLCVTVALNWLITLYNQLLYPNNTAICYPTTKHYYPGIHYCLYLIFLIKNRINKHLSFCFQSLPHWWKWYVNLTCLIFKIRLSWHIQLQLFTHFIKCSGKSRLQILNAKICRLLWNCL